MQEELDLYIGTEEISSLKPVKVKIEDVRIDEIGSKKSKKLVCICKHPQKEGLEISSAKLEVNGKLEVYGLWINRDSGGFIRKNSALAIFLKHLECNKISEIIGKEIHTTHNNKGYLVFKAY